jgi:hypothetical protein
MRQTETRAHKIKCHFGVEHYFSSYRKLSNNPQSSKIYRAVLKDYLDANRKAIYTSGYIFKLPQRLGRIEMRKSKKEVKIDKNGKVINKLPINWQATKKLWAENEQAKERKIKIRYTNEHTGGYVFRPRYIKNTANFKNKSLYKMSINREMRRNTKAAIMNKRMDAFLLSPNK